MKSIRVNEEEFESMFSRDHCIGKDNSLYRKLKDIKVKRDDVVVMYLGMEYPRTVRIVIGDVEEERELIWHCLL